MSRPSVPPERMSRYSSKRKRFSPLKSLMIAPGVTEPETCICAYAAGIPANSPATSTESVVFFMSTFLLAQEAPAACAGDVAAMDVLVAVHAGARKEPAALGGTPERFGLV